MNNKLITIGVIQKQPPWYWRVIGREYWKGWQIRVEANGLTALSEPADNPPTPEDVAATAIHTYNKTIKD